ncbi:MAG: hypothetical protein AABY22_36920, partial [Nanoarchaeota archaeon]
NVKIANKKADGVEFAINQLIQSGEIFNEDPESNALWQEEMEGYLSQFEPEEIQTSQLFG